MQSNKPLFTNRLLKFACLTALILVIPALQRAYGQNLIVNGDFNATTTGWTTSCVNIEAYGFETTYGGPSATNHVAEIDDQACMHQDVCALPGATYVYSMDASRRTGGGPNPCISHIKITGLDASLTAVATYVDMDYTRTNTVFALTPVTGIPGITVGSGSGVAYLRVELTDNTPGFLTLGMIVDNISLVMTSTATISGGSLTTCSGVPVSFSVSGVGPAGLGYVWSFGSDATPTSSTSSTPSAAWSSAGTKTVTVAVGNGVCFSDTLTYSVLVNPALHFNLFDTTCPHTPFMFAGVALTASGVYNDTLFNPGGCDTIRTLFLYVRPPIVTNFYHTMCNGESYTFNGHVFIATGTYTDTFLTPAGCDSVSALNLIVNPIPAPPVVTSVTYCQYEMPVPLIASGSSLMWYGPGIPPAGSPVAPSVVTATPGLTIYHITQTVLGCISDSAALLINIKPKPNPPAVRDTAYCQFSHAAPLTATGTSLQWYAAEVGSTPTTTAPVPASDAPGVFTWYVSQTVNGCESDKAAISAKIVTMPRFDVDRSRNIICQFDTMNLSYDGPPYATAYFWDLGTGDSVVSGSTSAPSVNIQFNTPGKRTIYLNVVGPEGMCSARDTVIVKVDTPAIASIDMQPITCVGDTIGLNLAYRSENAVSYTWEADNLPLNASPAVTIDNHNASTGGPFQITWNTPGLHIIKMIVTSTGNCKSKPFSDTVQVNKIPNAGFTFDTKGGTLCLEDSVLFKSLETGEQYSYYWTPVNYFKNVNEPNTWGKVNEYLGDVTLTVTDAFGCKAIHTQQFNPDACCKVFMPNAFTPGVNKSNNLYRPVSEGYHRFHEFRITNRWGETVFQSANDNVTWNGMYNDVPLDAGVYYYFLKFDCGGDTKIQKGDVTLIR